VPDDGSYELKHVALCGVTLKCCVGLCILVIYTQFIVPTKHMVLNTSKH